MLNGARINLKKTPRKVFFNSLIDFMKFESQSYQRHL